MAEKELNGHEKMGRKYCKICQSGKTKQIEDRYLQLKKMGKGYFTAAKIIKEELDVQFSHSGLRTHMIKHFGMNKEHVQAAYAKEKHKPKEGIEEDYAKEYVTKNITEIAKLDAMIEKDYELYQESAKVVQQNLDEFGKVPKTLAEFIRSLNLNITNSMKTKAELLGTDAEGRKAGAMETWIELLKRVDEEDA